MKFRQVFFRAVGLLLVLLPWMAIGQELLDTLWLRSAFPLRARFATADNLSNLYLITPQNAVEKYSPDGRLLTRYTNNRAGFATAVDATNPMKIIVWYADFRVVAFLDRNLTPLGELNLIQANYPEARTVASAADGNLWIYDEVAFQLKKISPEGTALAESQRLNALLPERLPIASLRDDGNSVYAFASDVGLLGFDAYAQFRYRQPIEGAKACMAAFERAACLTDSHLLLLDRLRLTERRLSLPPAAVAQKAPVWLAQGHLLVQNGAQLEVWQWRD